MPLPIDFTKELRTRPDIEVLVRAVRDAAASETETDALEWKSQVDLASKAGCATVAKGVLGFSNRDPDRAARTFGGCAYFLGGVEPGRLEGLTSIDVAKVEAGVRVYTGSEPRWRADYVEVDGKTVLVVTVEPPRPGDPIYPVSKAHLPAKGAAGPALPVGAVLVRHGASTDPASPADIAMLSSRAAARSGETLRLSLEVNEAEALRRVDVSEEALARLLSAERQRLEAPLSAIGRAGRQPVAYTGAFGGEYRTEEKYRDEVEAYLDKLRRNLRERLLARAVLHEVAPLRLLIRNDTDTTFSGVRIRLRLPTDVAVCPWKPELREAAELPTAPVPYGSARRERFGASIYPRLPTMRLPDVRGLWVPDTSWDEAAAETVVDFSDEQVRPHGTEPLPTLWPGITTDAPELIVAQWELTAAPPAKGRLRGTLDIKLADEVIDASVLLEDIDEET